MKHKQAALGQRAMAFREAEGDAPSGVAAD